MSMGGSQTTSSQTQIPQWLDSAAQEAVARSGYGAEIGYMPYIGPDIAAPSAGQQTAWNTTNSAASAFGLPTTDYQSTLPPSQNYNGVQGYSSYPMYQSSVDALGQVAPGQQAAYDAMFIDPITGAQPTAAPYYTGVPTAPDYVDPGSAPAPAPAPAYGSGYTGGNVHPEYGYIDEYHHAYQPRAM